MPNWISTAVPHDGTCRTPMTSAASTNPSARSGGSAQKAGRPHDQHQHQDAKARHVGIGRPDVERRQRLRRCPGTRPPTITPSGLSSPPMIAIANDLAVRRPPMYGLICDTMPYSPPAAPASAAPRPKVTA